MRDVKDILYETIAKASQKNEGLREENEKLKKQIQKLKEQMEEVGADTEVKEEDIITGVKEFLLKNEEPTDEQVHALAEEIGIEHEKLEEAIYKMLRNYIMAEVEQETDQDAVDIPGVEDQPTEEPPVEAPAAPEGE